MKKWSISKRVLAAALMILLVMTSATGCAKKETAQVLLQKSFDRVVAVDTATVDFTATAKVEANEALLASDASIQSVLDMINQGKVSGTMASDTKAGNMNGNIKVESNGMSFDFALNMLDFKKLIVKTPFMEQYVTLDMAAAAEGQEAQPVDAEKMKVLNKEISAIVLKNLKPEMLTTEYGVSFEGKEGKTKVDYVTITMDNASFYAFVKTAFPEIYNAPETRKSIEESIKASLAASGQPAEAADVSKQVDDLIAQFPTMIEEMEKAIAIDQVKIKMGIDKDYNVLTSVADIATTFKNEDQEIKAAINMNYEQHAINKPVEAAAIELTEENSMPFEDFMMSLLFGGM